MGLRHESTSKRFEELNNSEFILIRQTGSKVVSSVEHEVWALADLQ